MWRATTICCTGALILGLWSNVAVAASTPANKCVRARNTAAAKALGCLVKGENEILKGGSSDLDVCRDKLAAALGKAESKGSCPPGNALIVADRVDEAASAVLTALNAAAALTDDAKACVRAKNAAIGKHGSCMAGVFGKALDAKPADFAKCMLKLSGAFAKAESSPGCLTTGDADTVALVASGAWTNLAYGDLTGVSLDAQNLTRADLLAVNLTDASLVGVNLFVVDLRGANLNGADLTNANLSGVNLSQANLAGAILTGADLFVVLAVRLGGCPAALPAGWVCANNNLVGPYALLYDADLAGTSLVGVDMTGASLSDADLSGADLSGVTLTVASVMGADLTDTILAGATLTYANFGEANLINTDFSHANLSHASFYGDTSLVGIVWDQTTCSDDSVSDTNGASPESCCGHLIPAFPTTCSP